MIDFPTYPPEAFDADGYLTCTPRWVSPPHQVVGWLEETVGGNDRRRT